MPEKPNKLFWWVFGIHAAVIGGLLIAPLFHRRPKEIVTFVEFVSEPAPEAPVEVPVPIEEPIIEKAVVALPAPTNRVEKVKTPEKPKWKAAKVIPQNKRVTKTSEKTAPVTPSKKRITSSDIRNALNTGGGGTVGLPDVYDTLLFKRFYSAWQVPVGTVHGLSAIGAITVGANGTVSNRKLIAPSGDAAFDESVRKALNTVNRLPVPPSARINQQITIEFVPQ